MDLKSATLTYSKILLSKVGIWLAAIIRSAAGIGERNRFGFVSDSQEDPFLVLLWPKEK